MRSPSPSASSSGWKSDSLSACGWAKVRRWPPSCRIADSVVNSGRRSGIRLVTVRTMPSRPGGKASSWPWPVS